MRYIFTSGTVTPALMADQDARDSFFQGATLTGDFRGYDFRNASIADCTVSGDFSNVPMQYMNSVRSDWRAAKLPPDVSSFKHDLVEAVIRQRLAGMTGRNKTAAQQIINHIQRDYTKSWLSADYQLHNTGLVLPLDKMRTLTHMLFDGYPRLLARGLAVIDGAHGEFTPTPVTMPTTYEMRIGNGTIDLLTDPRVAGEDRWAIERTLEIPGWRVHIFALHPFPFGIAIDEVMVDAPRLARWDWYYELMGSDRES